MPRLFFAAPLCFAVALSAQVTPIPPVVPLRPAPAPIVHAVPFVYSVPHFDLPDFHIDLPDLHTFSYAFDDLAFTNISSMASDYASLASEYANIATAYALNDLPSFHFGGFGESGPVAWAQQDPADSLYRQARDQFSRGDYRRSADLFKSLPQRFPNSVYVADAQYWQAFSLYRIGGTPELREALVVLESRKPDSDQRPGAGHVSNASVNRATTDLINSRMQLTWTLSGHGGTDAAGLAARIANVLSSRGLASDPAVKRALAAGGDTCDQDDQSVRAEALSALMQNDPETGRQMAAKILAKRDECSVPLRRNAVMVVGNKRDDAAATTLIPVAKSDPSAGVRAEALTYLVRIQTDAAINAVIDMAKTDTSTQVQRTAIMALAQSSNPRARAEIRSIVESNTTSESVRLSAIDGFDRDRITAEDAAWLRGLYARTTSERVKERIISAVSRAGGDANSQWLLGLVRNDDESLDVRTAALSRAGRNMDVATLAKMYDSSPQRPIREAVLELLSQRSEPEALDKVVDIAKNGTDPSMRRQAIGILARSKDPRASKLLLQLVDK